jgi:hypothetical protein
MDARSGDGRFDACDGDGAYAQGPPAYQVLHGPTCIVPAVIRRSMVCVLTAAWLAFLTAPAAAQTGLYVPFPSGDPGQQARQYLERLGPRAQRAAASLSAGQIAAGAFLGGTRPTRDRAASLRAGGVSHEGPPWPVQVLLLLAPFGALVVAARN